MNQPSPGLPADSPIPNGVPRGIGPGDLPRREKEGVLSAPILRHRRLHYFLDLLSAGYRQALQPDASFRSLRGERIALGIDIPELDTVPLWAARRADGSISIPFIEFILGQISQNLDEICGAPGLGSSPSLRSLSELRFAIGSILKEAAPEGEADSSLPRLKDVYLPASVFDRLCGAGGFTEQIFQQCTMILTEMAGTPGH